MSSLVVLAIMLIQVNSQACKHPVYCQGPILHAVQTLSIFKDSKEFVDMPMKYSVDVVLENWKLVVDPTSITEVSVFVTNNFLAAGSDSEPVVPSDWTESPPFLTKIRDPVLRQWGSDVNAIWKTLSKRFTMDESQSSLIATPFPFVIAGGRFREFYYWDSLWITEGLLLSGMTDSAIHMLNNFAQMINKYGYVPNGARIYYQGRSQPPVTAMMADLIVKHLLENGQYQKAYNTIKQMFPVLEREYYFWTAKRSIKASSIFTTNADVLLFHYDGQAIPRPESYKEDLKLSEGVTDLPTFYRNVWAACESGLDFSSRWFKDGNDLKTVRASDIIPVDLNVFVTLNEQILSKFASHLEIFDKSKSYGNLASQRSSFLLTNLYNANMKQWNDFIISEKKLNENYYPSNFVPLLLLPQNSPLFTDVKDTLVALANGYRGGVPQSLVKNGQQWDFPNSWAPFNHLIIEGLKQNNDESLSLQFAQQWINNNYCSFTNSKAKYGEGYMFEKYDSENVGQQGGGGEYEIQKGFGWTNGVAISLLHHFGDKLVRPYTC